MTNLPESLFLNPVWHALQTMHRQFAISEGNACRYPADVAPFAAVGQPSEAAMRCLHSLLAPGESIWLTGDHYPRVPKLRFEETLICLQMELPDTVPRVEATTEVVRLTDEHAAEMVALTTIAFPGFFRARTNRMGSYYGIRGDAELLAMGGERLMLPGYPEISGVCTHPAFRGKGFARHLIWQLIRDHRRDGLVSWLHVSKTNYRAIELYLQIGFRVVREVTLTRVVRAA